MAKNSFYEWDSTASNNTDIAGIGIQGTNLPSNFDDALRTVMAQLKSGAENKPVYTLKSGNYTAIGTDINSYLVFSVASTLSLTAAATLGAGWHATIVAYGGDVTIDPNASETIDGKTTYIIPKGSSRLIICTGTSFVTAAGSGGAIRKVTFQTASTTHNFNAETHYALVEVWGAGGGGGGCAGSGATSAAFGSSGGAGGYASKLITLNAITSATITIGAGGTGGTGLANGSAGGNSSYADGTNTVTGNGGSGGTAVGATTTVQATPGGNGGSSSGGDISVSGEQGGMGYACGTSASGNASLALAYALPGGSTTVGAGGGASVVRNTVNDATNGSNGSGYGSGGSGAVRILYTTGNSVGGSGANGLVKITEYA